MKVEIAFGLVLKRLRNEKKLSQEELADSSGFHRTYISLLERGLKSPSLGTIERLCRALEVQMYQIFLLVEQELQKSKEIFKEIN